MSPATILLAEYERITRERATARARAQWSIGYGLAMLLLPVSALLFGGSAAQSGPLALPVLSFLIPSITLLMLLIWAGAIESALRVDDYLVTLEMDINDTLETDVLVWSNYVRHHSPPRYVVLAVPVLFLVMAAGSPLLGQFLSGADFDLLAPRVAVPGAAALVTVVFSLTRILRARDRAAIPRERQPWDTGDDVHVPGRTDR